MTAERLHQFDKKSLGRRCRASVLQLNLPYTPVTLYKKTLTQEIHRRNGLPNILRKGLNAELNAELNSELNAELNTEINAELNTELNSELKSELNAELNAELNLKVELNAELNPD